MHTRHAVVIVYLVFAGLPAAGGEPLIGGGKHVESPSSCLSLTDRAGIESKLAALPSVGQSSDSGEASPPLLRFFPLAGRMWGDLYLFNYVDLDPSVEFSDWNCTSRTYDGHQGSDTDIRSFGEQLIGVPVYSAQDGVVVDTHDGEPDMNTVWDNQPANYVIIDHGFGRLGWYFHFKKDSVAVVVGQRVRAGQQIGLCGSSGISTGPHLHFELRENGAVHEPFTGPCHDEVSSWEVQPEASEQSYVHDFGFSYQIISADWPAVWPRTGQVGLLDPVIRVWWYGTELPVGSGWRVQFFRPDGSMAFDGSEQFFGNSIPWRWYSWWWTYNVADMHTIMGTWRMKLIVNDIELVDAPIEVREMRTADFNRAPAAITADLVPQPAFPGDALICRVDSDLVLDDLDYDIVRYEYVWTVDDEEVRWVTTAAHSDTLPHHIAHYGESVACAVTPGDGRDVGPMSVASVMIQCPQRFDFSCDGDVDLVDYDSFFECWSGPGVPAAGMCGQADSDGDLDVDLADYGVFVQVYSGDCGARITGDPVDETVCPGESVVLSVGVEGGELAYEWMRDGVPISGETADTLTIDSVTKQDAGAYEVRVTGACGVDYSSAARVSLIAPPIVSTQPSSQSTCIGDSAIMSIQANDAGTLSYQWRRNGEDIAGADEPDYEVPFVAQDDLGQYSCVVSDGCGQQNSSMEATLTEWPEPLISVQPFGTTICEGESIFLFISAQNVTSYQWYKNGEVLQNGGSAFLSVSNASVVDSGGYHVVASSPCDSTQSKVAPVQVVFCR